jgi:hypothetical protein
MPQVLHDGTVIGSNLVRERDDPVGGRVSALVDIDLRRDGDAVKQSKFFAPTHGSVGFVGGLQRFFGTIVDNRIERGVELLDAIEAGPHDVAARNTSSAHCVGDADGIPLPEFAHFGFLHIFQDGHLDEISLARDRVSRVTVTLNFESRNDS